jgi:hypothetical protein
VYGFCAVIKAKSKVFTIPEIKHNDHTRSSRLFGGLTKCVLTKRADPLLSSDHETGSHGNVFTGNKGGTAGNGAFYTVRTQMLYGGQLRVVGGDEKGTQCLGDINTGT